MVAEAVATFEPVAAAKRIALVAQSPEPSILADFDHDRILQVLANLLTNAIKFSPEGCTISIRVEPAEGKALVCVGDSGPGISPNMLELIFERFWQAGKDDRRGLGLGLSHLPVHRRGPRRDDLGREHHGRGKPVVIHPSHHAWIARGEGMGHGPGPATLRVAPGPHLMRMMRCEERTGKELLMGAPRSGAGASRPGRRALRPW